MCNWFNFSTHCINSSTFICIKGENIKKIYSNLRVFISSYFIFIHIWMRVLQIIQPVCVCVWICGNFLVWPNFYFAHITHAPTMLVVFFIFDFHDFLIASHALSICGSLLLTPPNTVCPSLWHMAHVSSAFTSFSWHLLSTFNSCDCAKAFMCVKRANIIWFLGVLHRT